MLVVHVFVHVLPSAVSDFIEATRDNARASLQEPGVARFDLIQRKDDTNRFVLVEVYRDADAPARHKETAHYATWRDRVADMMAEPRTSVKYESLYPEPARWDTPAESA